MLDSQLGRLEAQIEDLEGRVRRAGDPGVVRANELELRKLRQDVDVFYKQNPNFKKGALTEKDLETSKEREGVDFLSALTKRFDDMHSDNDTGGSGDESEDSDDGWSD